MVLEFREEFHTAEAADKVPLDGREVVKGWWVEEVFVAGGCSYSVQLLDICVRNSNRQDTDSWKTQWQWSNAKWKTDGN